MNFNDILVLLFEYLDPRMLAIVVGLVVLGFFFKRTPHVPDWGIIWLLTFFGIVATTAIFGITVEGIVQGLIATAIAVQVHQLLKQSTTKRKEEQEDLRIGGST